MANTAINLASLDFDGVKSSLKEYLKSQSRFRDYDFDGSNMSVLLDVLAYNTYLNGFYLNMVASEQFLDSAQLRDSVISHAKAINYTPESARSPVATVSVTFSTSGIADTFTMPKGTEFSGTNANGSYTFVTDQAIVTTSTNSTFTFANVQLYEGVYLTDTFTVDYSVESQRFILSNPGVDATSLVVEVSEDYGATYSEFTRADTLYDLTPTSKVYFLQATTAGRYEVVFGDGIFGYRPATSALLSASYRVTAGTAGGGINKFYLSRDLGPVNGGSATATAITTISAASDGADAESIESIRFRAPRAYQSQDRAVTVADYKTLIFKNFPEVKDVAVFGGEEIPAAVEYGTVYISATTFSGTPITETRRDDLIRFLQDKKIINVQNRVIDPEYLYVIPSARTIVDFSKTTKSAAQIEVLVRDEIKQFNDEQLEIFNGSFRMSKFLEAVSSADPSIVSDTATARIYKTASPLLDIPSSFSVNLGNPIIPGTIESTPFQLTDGNTYQLVDYNPSTKTFERTSDLTSYSVTNTRPVVYLKLVTTSGTPTYTDAGVVDYTNGIVSINDVTINSFLDSKGVEVRATCTVPDVVASLNTVILIDTARTEVEIVAA
jgi:hypothetical protein